MKSSRLLIFTVFFAVLILVGCASAAQHITISNVVVNPGGTGTATVMMDEIPSGVAGGGIQGFTIDFASTNPSVASISAVSYPTALQTLSDTTTVPFTTGHISSVDLSTTNFYFPAGGTNIPMATLTFNGLSEGTTTFTATITELDDRQGNYINTQYTIDSPTVTVAVAPVAAFTSLPASPGIGDTVTFTDTSSGSPTSWDWDFGDSSTHATTQTATHTYTAAGTYHVKLTVTNAIALSDVTNDVVVASPVDLVVTAISPNVGVGASLFANEPNVLSVTVKNQGTATAAASTVSVTDAGVTSTAAVGALAAGANTTVTVTDNALLTGGSIASITATADSANVIGEADETNNALTTSFTVYNNGYKGKRYTDGSDIATQATYTGRVNVVYSVGNSAYISQWTTVTDTWTAANLSIPSTATVKTARLYQGYTWNSAASDPSTWTMTFNGNTFSPVATYTDTKGFASYNYPGGLVVWDVTSAFSASGNTMTLTKSASGYPSLYGAYLVVVYEDDSTQTEKTVYINDNFDMLYAGTARSASSDEATAYASFAGVDTTDISSAKAIAILSSANEAGKSKFFFNSNEYTGFSSDYMSMPQIGFSVYDVTSALASSTNTAKLQSYDTGAGGDSMAAQNVILVTEKTEAAVHADFTPSSEQIVATGKSVAFTDASTGYIVSYLWDFGDGTTSTDANPTHTFATTGSYTVKLTVTGVSSSDTRTRTDLIRVSDKPIISVVPVSGSVNVGESTTYAIQLDSAPNGLSGYNLYVTLTDGTKADITNVAYDSTWARYTVDPTVPADSVRIGAVDANQKIYPGTTGPYTLATITVKGVAVGSSAITLSGLTMDDDAGNAIDAVLNPGTITVGSYGGPTAAFTSDVTSGNAPLTVTFDSSASSGSITTYQWDFGDGATSTAANPTHQYTVIGSYNVKLTVSGLGGSNTLLKNAYITVGDGVAPTVTMITDKTTGNYPLTVAFSATTSGNVASYQWDFGDGAHSTLAAPSHTYTYPGTFTAKVTVTGTGGSASDTTTITATQDAPVAGIVANPESGTAQLQVQFTDASTGSISSYNWSFGDGAYSDEQNPVHTFTSAGIFDVTHTVTGPGGVSSPATKTITVTGLGVDFASNVTSGVASAEHALAVSFTSSVTGVTTGSTTYQWDFGDGQTSTEQNPIHTYYGHLKSFTVTLTIQNGADAASVTKPAYITTTPYVEAFPKDYNTDGSIKTYYTNVPTDTNGDYVYEDVNGNGRVDYDDVVAFFNAFENPSVGGAWLATNTDVDNAYDYDYSGNGSLGFEDITSLYDKILYH